ncbi:MAG: flippase-like domain-containing protein [Anaerolineaceae bacterium]|nr:flippase-like domain-containing protein [Anaerolineaceae bacterium]
MKLKSQKSSFNINIIWRWVPGFLLSFIAIFALVKLVPVDRAFDLLKSTPFSYYLLAALFTLLFLLVRTLGWRALLGFRPTYKNTFLKLCLGYFINNIFPFRLGEISRAVFMGASLNANPGHILSSIFIERVLDLIILAFFLLIMLPYVVGMAWIKTTAWLILGIMVIGLIVLFFVIRNSRPFENLLSRIGKKSNLLAKLIVPFFLSLLEGFKTLRNPKQFAAGFLGVLASWLVSFVQFSLFLFILTGTSEWWWGAFANTTLALGIALPSAPAGLGIYESSIVAGLKLFNIDESIALAFALIMHVSQFVLIGILGIYALIRDGYSLKNLFSQLVQFKDQLKDEQRSGEMHD